MGNNISTKVAEEFSENLAKNVKETLREIKVWAQVKSPKAIQPALSYTLDWLTPEILGTGFRIYEISETEINGRIPFKKNNLDATGQIHQGLILNASLELFHIELQRQFSRQFVSVQSTEITVSKKHDWTSDLSLTVLFEPKQLDLWMMKIQKNKRCEIEIECRIFTSEKLKQKGRTYDLVTIKAELEAKNLLA